MRFTIRDVLWLMIVVALVTVWWRDSRALKNQSVERIKLDILKAVVQKQQQEVERWQESSSYELRQAERYRMIVEAAER